ncbi:MAG: hypothetical protein ABSA44_06070 [Bacteroidota bacterium]|jgi:hypothetical protein
MMKRVLFYDAGGVFYDRNNSRLALVEIDTYALGIPMQISPVGIGLNSPH